MGGEAQAILEFQVEEGGGVKKKTCLPSWGCGFFSGIILSIYQTFLSEIVLCKH